MSSILFPVNEPVSAEMRESGNAMGSARFPVRDGLSILF